MLANRRCSFVLYFQTASIIELRKTVAKTLAQIRKQIAQLEEQAKSIRQREISGVVARIREAIAHYGLTADDLGFGGAAAAGRKTRKPRKTKGVRRAKAGRKTVGVVKYRDDAGNTWTGHGRRPKWFTDALAAGKTAEQMAA
jgi:DNA-binding protein H-NS